jgi:3-hydroxyisobutyrate dehydrogenase-like beta-hydroxyacid dehydrogenase
VTVGVVSLGAMGSAVAHALAAGDARVLATLAGRSDRTIRLAARASVELLPDLAAVVRESEIVISIVPPEAAPSVIADIAAAADRGDVGPLVADFNAVSPATVRAAAEVAAAAGCDLVDGSISGPPPWKARTTRIYLSGARASEVAGLPFEGVETIVVGPEVGSASAVKMSTASVYKGSTAVLLHALLAANTNGVLEHVLDDLRAGAPELVVSVERRLAKAASKSGRYVGEMHEIAATQAEAGLTPSLFEAMAAVYEELADTPLAQSGPEGIPAELSLDDVFRQLR